ncbi:MAG: methionine biosynthesis protein MetW [Solirubrobacteraceae bacterium]
MRPDLEVIAGMVPPRSRVLDVGCGDGTLLEHLIRHAGCTGQGVDASSHGFAACVARGVPVIQADVDAGLPAFADRSFDVAVLSLTLQATREPAFVLRELIRLAPVAIVSVPNFGHWRLRGQLGLRGRMPVSRTLPHPWHATPNIHLCTIRDLEDLLAAERLAVAELATLDGRGAARHGPLVRRWPNLFAAEVAVRVVPA